LALPSPPSWDDTRSYLEATLEQTLDLLAICPPVDDALWVYRWALQREDWAAESLAVAAQGLGVRPADELCPGTLGRPRLTSSPTVWMPPQRVSIGSAPGGFVPDNERWAHDVDLPACDMDAQVVSWTQFAEFADDGGYDRPELWSAPSWAWVQAQARRAPRYIEQLRQGILAERFGRLQRDAGHGAACHVSWHEADAWCRWAGRRLPSEVEWEAAAVTAASRGWIWGEVWEWVAGTARAWPSGPALDESAGTRHVLRGASRWTVPRAAHPRQRRFVAAERDELFVGFRSCAL
jgi:formylglycine-generating enzyme required for sulfatase activity